VKRDRPKAALAGYVRSEAPLVGGTAPVAALFADTSYPSAPRCLRHWKAEHAPVQKFHTKHPTRRSQAFRTSPSAAPSVLETWRPGATAWPAVKALSRVEPWKRRTALVPKRYRPEGGLYKSSLSARDCPARSKSLFEGGLGPPDGFEGVTAAAKRRTTILKWGH